MFTKAVAAFLVVLIATANALAADRIIAMCYPGVMSVPPPGTGCPLQDAVITASDVYNALSVNEVTAIAKVFRIGNP
jgi:hypothetical protein